MRWFTFFILAVLFIVTPFQKGLYFAKDFYPISIFMLTLFLVLFLRWTLYKEIAQLNNVMIILLLPLCYLLPLFIAESPRGAWDSIIRWTTYTAFFLGLYWVTLKHEIKKWMPLIFNLTGLWISFHMLFIDAGWLSFRNSYVAGRSSGVFQYPNTFAMVLGVFFLFSLIMLTKRNLSFKYIAFYSIPLVPHLLNILLSESRGMLVVLPFVIFIGLWLLSVKQQVIYITITIVASLSAFLTYRMMTVQDRFSFGAWMIILLSSAIIFFVNYVLDKSLETKEIRSIYRFIVPALILFIGIAGLLDLKNEGLIYRALPVEFQDRVDTINLTTASAAERIHFLEDGLKISNTSPIIGLGGEAWSAVYREYQQTPYLSNKAHNGFLEWLVDTGWLGILLFVTVFGYFLVNIFRSLLKEKDNPIYIGVLLSVSTIFAHSFIDFNFSYGTVWLLVFWLLVMGISDNPIKERKLPTRLPIISMSLLTITVAICLVFSFQFMKASQNYEQAKGTKSLDAKQVLLENAVRKHPQNTRYLFDLSDVYIRSLEEKGPEVDIMEKLNVLLEKLIVLEPNNSSVLVKAASTYYQLGNFDKAITYYNAALAIDRYNTKLYELSIAAKVNQAIKANDPALVESALRDYERMKHEERLLVERSMPSAFNSRKFGVTHAVHYQASLAHYKHENYKEIIDIYKKAEEKSLKLAVLTALAYYQTGEVDKAKELEKTQDSTKFDEEMQLLKRKFAKSN
ncbi:O-antigen ligase family protein [Ferdinandcohnia sp. Marseille-Q9671]